jgi:hypothetical protein
MKEQKFENVQPFTAYAFLLYEENYLTIKKFKFLMAVYSFFAESSRPRPQYRIINIYDEQLAGTIRYVLLMVLTCGSRQP